MSTWTWLFLFGAIITANVGWIFNACDIFKINESIEKLKTDVEKRLHAELLSNKKRIDDLEERLAK